MANTRTSSVYLWKKEFHKQLLSVMESGENLSCMHKLTEDPDVQFPQIAHQYLKDTHQGVRADKVKKSYLFRLY